MPGLKWRWKPDVRTIWEIAGKLIRVAASKLGKITPGLLKTHPVHARWGNTPGAMKHGLVDCMNSLFSHERYRRFA